MKKWILGIGLAIVAALGISWFSMDKDMRTLASNLPTNSDVLFWTIPQRDAAFRTIDRIPALAKSNIIEAGDKVYPLPKGAPLLLDTDVDAYMKAQRTAGYDGTEVDLVGRGRHDPCVLPRAVPIVEAMAALVLADLALIQRSRR